MTSLIFWGPYLAHKSVISHKREKQRLKNYQRWEDLRDDYDEQRKLTRETRSLDIQRTGTWDGQQFVPSPAPYEEPPHCLTLRDQQEANDARTGWRPQEAWDGPRTQMQAQMTGQVQQIPQPHMQPQRHVSMTPTVAPQMTGQSNSSTTLPLRSQKTGATWDEGLPSRLAVSRQSFDDFDYHRYRSSSTQSMPVSRDASLSRTSTAANQDYFAANQLSPQNSVSRTTTNLSRQASISRTQTPSGLRESTPAPAAAEVQDVSMPRVQRMYSPPEVQVTSVVELPKNEFGFVEPARIAAGGRMAELIERGY